jgi:hypothetical protein
VGSSRATTAGGITTWANDTGDRRIGNIERKGNGVWDSTWDEAARFAFPGACATAILPITAFSLIFTRFSSPAVNSITSAAWQG